ncbi:glutamate 5-kinase [Sphingorhabdus sp.]|jgi:glutamate 5-kinase|uniref:glutamate 5-kinase n=1 Tax=Sphingorhabdus sp. TaxID=1902408 RepID=UPI003BAFE59F|nr:glutamate 5-kinase [Sphingomonadales bacterium]MBL0022190.1 glutamate 5-kinase [Sphingomonadales bacterium]
MVSHLNAASCPLLVVKVGSSLLVEPDGRVRRGWIETLVADIAARHSAGQRIIIVSSGAIALGARRLGLEKGGRASLSDAQASASVGQIILSGLWAGLLEAKGLTAAQMLVTLDDLEDRRRYLNIAATLDRLLGAGAVPVINENDSVATQEIRFGDNDRLAARVAQAAGASEVVLLSDVDGLYDRNPADPEAQIVPQVKRIDGKIRAMVAGGSSSGMGSGGMESKLDAADIATRAGIGLAIASGLRDHPLAALDADAAATWFAPREGANARKAWLGGRLTVKGRILVDAGAVSALGNGSSLLPAGAVSVQGDFRRGDVVDVVGPDGDVLARGLSEYDAAEALLICGKRSGELAAILGTVPRSVLVHRDQLVLL